MKEMEIHVCEGVTLLYFYSRSPGDEAVHSQTQKPVGTPIYPSMNRTNIVSTVSIQDQDFPRHNLDDT